MTIEAVQPSERFLFLHDGGLLHAALMTQCTAVVAKTSSVAS
jgi:hypothetical protein